MNEAKISVIVPVYNVENYIRRCLDSIIGQTYSNLEIILIDDGTKDNSGIICDEYAAGDSRIRVIHQQNGGLSAARNSGLDEATGDYIFFVDSDDYIDLQTLEIMINKAQSEAYDVVACGIDLIWDDDKADLNCRFTSTEAGEWNGRVAVLEMQLSNNICSVAWNKLYKAYLWKELRFPVGKLHEDEYIAHKVLFNCKRVAYIPNTFYKYYQRATGINAGATRDDRDDHLEAFYERYLYFKDTDDRELIEWSLVKYLEYIKYLYRNAQSAERKTELSKRYRLHYDLIKSYKYVGIYKRFALALWKYWKY